MLLFLLFVLDFLCDKERTRILEERTGILEGCEYQKYESHCVDKLLTLAFLI